MAYPYLWAKAYPSRFGSTHFMASWNDHQEPVQLDRVIIYTTYTAATSVKLNTTWYWDDDNPFSNSMSYIAKINVTEYAGDGELYESYFASDVTIVFCLFYYSEGKQWLLYYAVQNNFGDNHITYAAPSISYNNDTITIGSLCYGRRIIEFRRADMPFGGDTGIDDEETLSEMYYTSLVNMERSNPYQAYYYLSSNPRLERWRPGTYSVGVNFRTPTRQAKISSAIDNAITQVNSVMRSHGVTLVRGGTSGNITITVDSESSLYPSASYTNYYYGGTWDTQVSDNGYIYGATIKLANDFQDYACFASYETVAFEELLQCMGAGYDQIEYPYDTIHTDFNYYNKRAYMYPKDANILRLVYSSAVNAGDSYVDVARKLNIPNGCYLVDNSSSDYTRTVSASSFLTKGGRYEIRAFIVDSGGYVSGTSDWITIEVPAITKWDWDANNYTRKAYNALHTGGGLSDFSYVVWNQLCSKVKDIVDYLGVGWDTYGDGGLSYNATLMSSSNKVLTADRFNTLRYNIGSRYSTGIQSVSPGDTVYASYFLRLADSINGWIDTFS